MSSPSEGIIESPVNADNSSTDVVIGIDKSSETVSTVVSDVDVEVVVEEAKDRVNDVISESVEEVVANKVVQGLVESVAEQVVDKAFNDLVEKLNVKIGNLEITPQSIMMVVRFSMEVVETTELKGKEQKEMVLRLLEHVIRVAPISDEKEALCLNMLKEGVVSNTIDIIVDATQGKLDINTVVENAVEIATSSGCCGLLSLITPKKSA